MSEINIDISMSLMNFFLIFFCDSGFFDFFTTISCSGIEALC